MQSFKDISLENKPQFEDLLYKEHLEILKKEIRYHVLKGNESDFYDLDSFNRKYVKNVEKTMSMVKEIQEDLKKIGWNTCLGFGDTGLYIYSGDQNPLQGNFL